MSSDHQTVTGDVLDPTLVSNYVLVSSPGFGGGPSVCQTGTTSGETDITTPPLPLHLGAAVIEGKHSPETAEVETQTDSFCVYTFSSATCKELLPRLTSDQLQFETNYLNTLLNRPQVRFTRKFDNLTTLNSLKADMSSSLCTDDLFSVLNGHDKLISDFAYLVTRAEEQLSRLRELNVTSAAKESPVTPPHLLDPAAPVDLLTPAEVGMNESVCDFINSVSFADLSVAEILEL